MSRCVPAQVVSSPIKSTLPGALIAAGLMLFSGPALAQNERLAYMPPAPVADADRTVAPGSQQPLFSLISLNKQRMYVYGADGLITQSRVSTGSAGYDTPRGIYSVIQKKADHASNLYEGAPMPHMQRLLWSGIALHGGEVPNHPASHGCVRLPWDFAEQYFGMTSLNHRIVITPEVQAPVAFSHPRLFSALPGIEERTRAQLDRIHGRSPGDRASLRLAALGPDDALQALIAEREAEKVRVFEAQKSTLSALENARTASVAATDNIATRKKMLNEARDQAARLQTAAKKSLAAQRSARSKWDDLNKRVERGAASMRADKLMAARGGVLAKRVEVDRLIAAAEADAAAARSAQATVSEYAKLAKDAVTQAASARKTVVTAEAAAKAANDAVETYQLIERQRPKPISIFVSARTGRVALRQGFEPIAEADVAIANPRTPLGSYIFTATGWEDESKTKLKWLVTAVNENGLGTQRGRNSDATKLPPATDARRAAAALERITIPEDIKVRIAEVVKPGSTLILSDYDMARSETGKGTDFIVQMPEVIAKVRTPEDVAAKRRSRNTTRYVTVQPGFYDYGYGDGYSGLGRPPKVVYRAGQPAPVVKKRYKSQIPSFFGYYDD